MVSEVSRRTKEMYVVVILDVQNAFSSYGEVGIEENLLLGYCKVRKDHNSRIFYQPQHRGLHDGHFCRI